MPSTGRWGVLPLSRRRAAFVVAKDKDDPGRRLRLPVKNNLAPDEGGLAFCVDQDGSSAPVITWEQGTVTMTADDALQPLGMPPPVRPTAQRQAETWLRDQMASGTVPAEEIATKAEQAGISTSTLSRAKQALGIRSKKVGDCWYYVPGAEQRASSACP
jgi:putative DNA primase/helicase